MFRLCKSIVSNMRLGFIHARMKFVPDLYSNHILIIAPHPDDETIGCGGLISRLCALGRPPHVAILTGGSGSHRGCCDISESEVISHRRDLTLRSAQIMGLPESNIHTFDFTDGHIADLPPAQIERLNGLISELKPDAIFLPHSGEGWPDHLAARKIGLDIAFENTVVYEYCVWMWYYNVWRLDWKNARRLKMSADEHATKLRAIDAYIRPTAPCGHPWSGKLPQAFIRANSHDTELYFRLK